MGRERLLVSNGQWLDYSTQKDLKHTIQHDFGKQLIYEVNSIILLFTTFAIVNEDCLGKGFTEQKCPA